MVGKQLPSKIQVFSPSFGTEVLVSAQTDAQGYRNLGNVSRFPEIAAIYGAILGRLMHFMLPDGRRIRTKIMGAPERLVVVDHQGLRYVEQNLRTKSEYAKRAREGARIVWVIRGRDNAWLGRIEDGNVWMR
jgi:hypothetical protein